MAFQIKMGIPEMKKLWTDLQQKHHAGTANKQEEQLYKKWGSALKKLSENPMYPALHSHEITSLSKRYGMKVWQSYLENRKSAAKRMYWVYGPDHNDITIIGLEPHPEDKKNGGYDKVKLSDIENVSAEDKWSSLSTAANMFSEDYMDKGRNEQ